MTHSNEIVLKDGGLTYSGGPFDTQDWGLNRGEIEEKNFFLIRLLMQKKRRRRRKKVTLEPGHGVLTDRRFIYSKSKALNDKDKSVSFAQNGEYFGIPLANIVNVSVIKASANTLEGECIVETKGGSYRFLVSKPDEWEAAFNEALAKREAEPVPANYCSKCGNKFDNVEICPDCGLSKKGKFQISDKTKNYITKMWLFGLLGTLGVHFYTSGRKQRGMLRTVGGIVLWSLCILFVVLGDLTEEVVMRFTIACFAMLFFLPVVDLIIIRIGKFRDVYGKYVILQ